jgi:hypothetical protein
MPRRPSGPYCHARPALQLEFWYPVWYPHRWGRGKRRRWGCTFGSIRSPGYIWAHPTPMHPPPPIVPIRFDGRSWLEFWYPDRGSGGKRRSPLRRRLIRSSGYILGPGPTRCPRIPQECPVSIRWAALRLELYTRSDTRIQEQKERLRSLFGAACVCVFGFCSIGYGDHRFARNLFRQDLQSACPIIRLKNYCGEFSAVGFLP